MILNNLVIYYLCDCTTATRPITETAVAQVSNFLLYSSLLEESVSVTEFQAAGANSSLVWTRAHEGVSGKKNSVMESMSMPR